MRKFALSAWMLAGLCLHLPLVHAAELIGFREVTLADASQQRPLHVALWYPTTTTAPLLPSAANPIFQGVATIKDAAPSGSAHPLVVLSHGYRGNWRNLSWLVSSLVDQGYIVAAPDHPGTTTFDQRPAEAAKLWERPRDLSRVIDKLTLDNTLAGSVDPQRIAAIGHSLGGWTVTALAGARYSPQRYLEECRLHPNPRLCQIAPELGITAHNQGPLSADLRDPRVKAVVALDLGFARGFTPESLSTLHTPVLVLGAGVNIADMPVEEESGYLNAHLASPPSRYEVLANASHFSFMQVCKPGAVALLKEEAPGDEIICRDGDAGDRQDIHRQVAKLIGDFLDQKLAGQPPAG
ncbi:MULTISPECIES: alpha/beta fold hydrolase [unclassified Pseudomonas]|uniref:alpha/beta hydrolase family protein n=1 Tax=Pseudomonas TaxID=286 RepID=UPI001473D926|nr:MULTISPECIES: alpha/beta fold hydrolase [unclassified Pseudomonas]MBW8356234.1 alpha/beta fold hydrolase [Pseudomonas sp.]NMY72558.1 alpha/beta fold hydrolase [Pseudomonas sp. WS 5414]